MLNPSQWTIGELSSAVKDYGIFVTVVVLGWKGRAAIQPCIDLFKKASAFFDRADKHMTQMESDMSLLLNNHLSHLKQSQPELDSKKSE